jgi:hypothetical protein
MLISHAQGELLAQVRPGVTTPVTLFQASKLRVEVVLILLALDTGTADISLYHDDTGTTYTNSNRIALMTRTLLLDPRIFQAQHPGSGIMIKPSGSLGIATSVASVLTASVYGITESIADRIRGAVNG